MSRPMSEEKREAIRREILACPRSDREQGWAARLAKRLGVARSTVERIRGELIEAGAYRSANEMTHERVIRMAWW